MTQLTWLLALQEWSCPYVLSNSQSLGVLHNARSLTTRERKDEFESIESGWTYKDVNRGNSPKMLGMVPVSLL